MFLAAAKRTPVDLHEWAVSMMERHNRKSHLAPQLSPSTQALLRGEPTASPGLESLSISSKTPTSGDIPIVEDYPRQAPIVTDLAAGQIAVNGTGMYQPQTVTFDRQGFPPRSSSNFSAPAARPRDSNTFSPGTSTRFPPRDNSGFTSTTLPIRNAPPSGALPQPPDTAFRNSTSRTPGANGSPYPYGEQTQF